jgi:hypothetical protein
MPLFRLTGVPRFAGCQIVSPQPVWLSITAKGVSLLTQMQKDADKDEMLEDFFETAGMEGVAVIHVPLKPVRAASRCESRM